MKPEICIRAAGSYDPETRIFTATFAATAAVDRRDAQGPYREVLPLDLIDPATLVGRTVFLDHRHTTDAAVGTVIAARREGDSIVGDVQLSAADSVADVRTKVAEGVIAAVSIGGAVGRWRVGRDASGRRTMTAEDFTATELSLVGIGADSRALIRNQEDPMDPVQQTTPEAAPAPAPQPIIRAHVAPTGSEDPAAQFAARVEALSCRMAGGEPSAVARQFMGFGFAEFAHDALIRSGETGLGVMSREGVLHRALQGTSDYAALLTGAGQRTLASGYQVAASPLKALAQRVTASDFRRNDILAIGGLGTLAEVTENGEITATSTAEAKESWQLKTFGRTFGLTRKALVNDDLSAFGRVVTELGKAAAETENAALVDLLTSNCGAGPTMGDSVALFHSTHGNLAGTGAAPDASAIKASILAMQAQRGLGGELISVKPKFLLTGPALQFLAAELLAAVSPIKVDDVNIISGLLEPICDVRLTGNAWYVLAAPSEVPTLLLGHLASAPGPQISSREGWEVLGREFRVVLDFGVAAVDYRGAYRNAGA